MFAQISVDGVEVQFSTLDGINQLYEQIEQALTTRGITIRTESRDGTEVTLSVSRCICDEAAFVHEVQMAFGEDRFQCS